MQSKLYKNTDKNYSKGKKFCGQRVVLSVILAILNLVGFTECAVTLKVIVDILKLIKIHSLILSIPYICLNVKGFKINVRKSHKNQQKKGKKK